MKVTSEYIAKELFASGDIYWNKKSGEKILITKAHDVINCELIQKLLRNDCEVTLERGGHDFNDDVVSWFEASSNEVSIKTKIAFRKKIIQSILISSVGKNEPSFVLDKLAWKMFSLSSPLQIQKYIIKDFDIFKRSLSIAGSFTLCAYLMGCYDEKFLRKTYTEMLNKLLIVMDDCPVIKLKATIDSLRVKDTFSTQDQKIIEENFGKYLNDEIVIFERNDGSGFRGLRANELSDLERLLTGVHRYFGFNSYKQENVFDAINNGSFKIDKKIRSLVIHEISKKENSLGNVG